MRFLEIIKEKLRLKYLYAKAYVISFVNSEEVQTTKEKQAYILLAANYNNLGDIAITMAQEYFVRGIIDKDYEIIIVPVDKTFQKYRSIKRTINKYTIITLIGGGNNGSLYEFVEWPRRFILKSFRNVRIISFPQSVYYQSDMQGIVRKKEFIGLCKKCSDLTLIAREKQSFDYYQKMSLDNVRILLAPDIAFSINNKNEKNNNLRCGACIIFRDDNEKMNDDHRKGELIHYLNNEYRDISCEDTCDVCITENGYKELDSYLKMLSSKELVVTDRLHGMILSYISKTPCIVLNNNNNKIGSTFHTWLNEQTIVKYLPDNIDFNSLIETKEMDKYCDLTKYYEPIIALFRRQDKFDNTK